MLLKNRRRVGTEGPAGATALKANGPCALGEVLKLPALVWAECAGGHAVRLGQQLGQSGCEWTHANAGVVLSRWTICIQRVSSIRLLLPTLSMGTQ